VATDYKIKISALTASGVEGSLSDISNGSFSVVYTVPDSTTTTTTPYNSEIPDLTSMTAIPVLDLENDYVTSMLFDSFNNRVFFGTNSGRILMATQMLMNANMTGQRIVYAEARDGFGNVSDTATLGFFYGLYRRIAEINRDKELTRWKFESPYSSVVSDSITGTFLSPILHVKEDLGFWKKLMWDELKPEGSDIIICVRSASTLEALYKSPWDNCFVSNANDRLYGMGSLIVRDLNDINMNGQYIQFRVMMVSTQQFVTPIVTNVTISYSTKYAVYFYTVKFSVENNANIKRGLMVANITEPIHTEVKIGVTDKASTNWNDYAVMKFNEFFDLANYENVKVGVKMISYDEQVPEVAEFALLMGGEKMHTIGNV
jgi:hypothetical protein